MKALLKVGYTCNNNCVFCHSSEHREEPDLTTAALVARIDACAAAGHDMVVLSGGEPTIRPDLLHVAQHAAERGLDFGLVTNGRMLAYGTLLDRLAARRLRYLCVSLHGDEATHDAMVRAPAHAESLAGVRAAARRGLRPTVNCVVTRRNLGALSALVDALADAGPLTVKLSMVEPKGRALEAFAAVVPTVTAAAAAIADAIARARARGLAGAHDGTPLCLLPGLEERYDDLARSGFAVMAEAFEHELQPVDDGQRVWPAPCSGCALAARCPGLYRAYLDRHGDGELRPRR
jgi:MoaA/NifB/PqqE/SkfB family radical SAM enzyme